MLLYSYDINVGSLCWLADRTLYRSANNLLEELESMKIYSERRLLLFVVHSVTVRES